MAGLSREELEARLREFVGKVTGPAAAGPDPVNAPMIRHWCQAMGDGNPVYVDAEEAGKSVHGGLVAPPTMLQAWILPGPGMADPDRAPEDLQNQLHRLLTENGYPSVVATNSEQGYTRYLRPGDLVSARTTIERISEQKATALGKGYFIDTRTVFTDQGGDEVGWMTFRVLKFTPNAQPAAAAGGEAAAAPKPTRLRPPLDFDNGWWWERVREGVLPIQKCAGCGALRHPPRPMCGECRSTEWTSVAASGRGTVYSYVVMHHPKFPGFDYPFAVGLIELEEGTRLVSNVVGCDPEEVHIGMPVELSIEKVDDELVLPLFRPAAAG